MMVTYFRFEIQGWVRYQIDRCVSALFRWYSKVNQRKNPAFEIKTRNEGPDLETKEILENNITGYSHAAPSRQRVNLQQRQPRHRYLDVYKLILAHLSSKAHNFGGGVLVLTK